MIKPFLLLALLSQLLISCSLTGSGALEHTDVTASHHLKLHIDPEASFLQAVNTFSYDQPFVVKTLRLLGSLEVYEMSHSIGNYTYETEAAGNNQQKITITNQAPAHKELPVFTFKYRGRIYDRPAETTLTQTHATTSGIISPHEDEGLYLPPSAFYPVSPDEMALFRLEARVPASYTIVTSGTKSKELQGEQAVFRYKTDFPIAGLTLTGGRFQKDYRMHDGVEFALYTYAENRFSEQYLKASIEYYDLYTSLFGPYPFDAFRIVENFFDTGFGMPGYTLLSGRLLQMPWVTLSPGSLAHEFVHNWWGNSVFVDYDQGNWCEALTTFSTNYYYHVLTGNEEAALDWRKSALISIDDLPAGRRYPVSDFISQRDTYDAVIGYQQGAFSFYELYKVMGKDAFFGALKDFAAKHRGRRASWDDLIDAFAGQKAGMRHKADIRKLAEQLFHSTDIPDLWFEEAGFDPEGMQLHIRLRQDMDVYSLVPIVYGRSEQTATEQVLVRGKAGEVTIGTTFAPDAVRIDPDLHVLRRLNNWEKPYNLYRTLNAAPVVILPGQDTPDYPVARDFLSMLQQSGYDFEAMPASEVTEEFLNEHAVMVLGNVRSNPLFEKVARAVPGHLAFGEQSITFRGEDLANSQHLLLFSSDHPTNPDLLCTGIYFDGLTDASAFRRLFHYQRVSLVLLHHGQAGRPVATEEIMPAAGDRKRLWREL